MEERERRQALAAFLHTRRARLTQAEVGLPARSRHRTPELRRVVDVLTPHPAFVIGRRWDILFRNQATDLIFCFDEPFPPHSLNVVWRSFQMQGHSLDLDWEVQARNLVAHFRADYARYPGDASLLSWCDGEKDAECAAFTNLTFYGD